VTQSDNEKSERARKIINGSGFPLRAFEIEEGR
jgi:hypothetical protein